MTDIILIAIVALIVGLAIGYIAKEKKKGTACVGCPMAGECAKRREAAKAAAGDNSCSGSCSGCSGCSGSCSPAGK